MRSSIVRFVAVAAVLVLAGCSRKDTPPLVSTAQASEAHATSASVTGASGDASATRPFGAACVADGECSGGVCFHKRIKGADAGKEHRGDNGPVEHDGYCSMRCNDDADCPVPLTKGRCGARGMCKRPD